MPQSRKRHREYMREYRMRQRAEQNKNVLPAPARRANVPRRATLPKFVGQLANMFHALPVQTPKHAQTKQSAVPARSHRRELGEHYNTLRQLGFSDDAAQKLLRAYREELQAQATTDARNDSLAKLAQEFREQAYIWLCVNSGCITEADITRVSMQMAENDLHAQIPPRKMEDSPRRIAAPGGTVGQMRYQPGCEPGQGRALL